MTSKLQNKKGYVYATLIGLVFSGIVGQIAWQHNPQQEYHIGSIPTLDFLILITISFCMGFAVTLFIFALFKIR
ncbi:MAG: hypothetical protein HWE16_06290 [Gammaproteobacteria bacterium]|nr:hypothetical protein [Gammaproteobacteria bacterium]